MKYNAILLKAIVIILLTYSSDAYADHSTWSKNRSLYSTTGAYNNQLEYQQITLNGDEPLTLMGAAMKASVMSEFNKFARFSFYLLYRDLGFMTFDNVSGGEIGTDVRLVFGGPFLNIEFGLGISGSALTRVSEKDIRHFNANGVFGSFALEHFVSADTALTIGVKSQYERLHTRSVKQSSTIAKTSAVTFGVSFWRK